MSVLCTCNIRREKRNSHNPGYTMGSEEACGAVGGSSVWRRLSLLHRGGAQTNATTSWVMDTTTTTTRRPRRCAIVTYDIYHEGECVCKVEHESASAVGVFYRGIFLRADSGTLSAPRTRMHIIDASVRSPEVFSSTTPYFSPEALSARSTEEERRSSEVEPPPVGWPWPWPPKGLWRPPPDEHAG